MKRSDELKFSPEENIRRIIMDKKTKYIVVEGEEDVPKYEQTIRALISQDFDFEPIFVGGRKNIEALLKSNPNRNFMAIADSDFNKEALTSDNRVVVLSRYSIENFMFCNTVLSALIANVVNDTEANVRAWFNLSDWINHLHRRLFFLLKSLHFYQKNIYNKKKWSKVDLNMINSWEICEIKISDFLNHLYDNSVPTEEIEKSDQFNNITEREFVKYFPGKLLITSLYRFIYMKLIDKYGTAKKLTTRVGNQDSLIFSCSPFLHRQHDLRTELKGIADFFAVTT